MVILNLYEGCSNKTQSGTVVGKGVEAVKNSTYRSSGKHLIDKQTNRSPLKGIPWAASRITQPLQFWHLLLTQTYGL